MATYSFVALAIGTLVATEVLRSVVHRRREPRSGIGGTQDIALGGTLIALACFVVAGACAIGWYRAG